MWSLWILRQKNHDFLSLGYNSVSYSLQPKHISINLWKKHITFPQDQNIGIVVFVILWILNLGQNISCLFFLHVINSWVISLIKNTWVLTFRKKMDDFFPWSLNFACNIIRITGHGVCEYYHHGETNPWFFTFKLEICEL